MSKENPTQDELNAIGQYLNDPMSGAEPPSWYVDPVTQASIDELENIKAVKDAWTNPGPVPFYHNKWKHLLRSDWPTLADALDKLTGER